MRSRCFHEVRDLNAPLPPAPTKAQLLTPAGGRRKQLRNRRFLELEPDPPSLWSSYLLPGGGVEGGVEEWKEEWKEPGGGAT